MAVADISPVIEHIGNGVTIAFPFDFRVIDPATLFVSLDGVSTGAYTLSIDVPPDEGGLVTMNAAPGVGVIVRIERVLPYSRSRDYQQGGDLPEQTLDDDQDEPVMMIQQLVAGLNALSARAVRVPVGETINQLPAAISRANLLLGFAPDGQIQLYTLPPGSGAFTQQNIMDFIAAMLLPGTHIDSITYDGTHATINAETQSGGGGGSDSESRERLWLNWG